MTFDSPVFALLALKPVSLTALKRYSTESNTMLDCLAFGFFAEGRVRDQKGVGVGRGGWNKLKRINALCYPSCLPYNDFISIVLFHAKHAQLR